MRHGSRSKSKVPFWGLAISPTVWSILKAFFAGLFTQLQRTHSHMLRQKEAPKKCSPPFLGLHFSLYQQKHVLFFLRYPVLITNFAMSITKQNNLQTLCRMRSHQTAGGGGGGQSVAIHLGGCGWVVGFSGWFCLLYTD